MEYVDYIGFRAGNGNGLCRDYIGATFPISPTENQ